jgi:hypothetical protein
MKIENVNYLPIFSKHKELKFNCAIFTILTIFTIFYDTEVKFQSHPSLKMIQNDPDVVGLNPAGDDEIFFFLLFTAFLFKVNV